LQPAHCRAATSKQQAASNDLSFDLFGKVFRTLRSTTKGVASGHHHLLQKVDENFIFKILSAKRLSQHTAKLE